MSRFAFVLALIPILSWAKPWQKIEPGASKRADVLARFGEPTRTVATARQEVFIYSGAQAIPGTVQAQFRCEIKTGKVERIDVYPAPHLETDDIERAYGFMCQPNDTTDRCYTRKTTAQKRVYFLFEKLGLAVFFKDDAQTVQSLAFLPGRSL
jgi:hypothetical protein